MGRPACKFVVGAGGFGLRPKHDLKAKSIPRSRPLQPHQNHLRLLIMRAKNLLIGAALVAVGMVASGCFVGMKSSTSTGGGPKMSVSSTQGNFTKIRLEGAADIKWSVGPRSSLTIEGPQDAVKNTETKVENGWLVISQKPMTHIDGDVTVAINGTSLEEIELFGTGNVDATGLKGKSFRASLNGAGNVTVSGEVDTVELVVAGAGNLFADNLKAKDVSVRVSGSGNADVYSSGSLDAQVSGVGNISYAGKPGKVNQSVSGIGRIDPK